MDNCIVFVSALIQKFHNVSMLISNIQTAHTGSYMYVLISLNYITIQLLRFAEIASADSAFLH